MLDRDEFERWHRQAEHTWDSACRDRDDGDFAWACFKAQHPAEFALKAALRAFGRVAAGHAAHVLTGLLAQAGIEVPPEVREAARRLDVHYIPSRYPDAFPAGAPFEYYGEGEAAQAIAEARAVLDWVRAAIADA